MNKSRIIKVSIALLLIVIVGVLVFTFRTSIQSKLQVVTSGTSITLQSKVPNKSLAWESRDSLESVINQLQIFTTGARDLKTNAVQPVSSIYIVYTPEPQTTFKNVTYEQKIISGGSYMLSNKTLTISVYVDPELAPNKDVYATFNHKLIEVLVALSTTSATRSSALGEATTIEDRMNYFYSILKDNFTSKPYPVKII